MEHTLFKENKVYCYCSYKDNVDIVEIDLLLYPKIISIINHCKETLEPIINNGAFVYIFGNVRGNDFFASNDNTLVEYIFRNSYFDNYHNDFSEIVDNFESDINDEYPTFESDGYMMGESTFNWVPENETNWFTASEKITEDGWNSIADDFIETVEEIVENYPIAITESIKSDFDDIEYTNLKVRFEIEPMCNSYKI